ncbi:MAG: AMP-dependent synthetase and ligase [Nocardia sp.]|uniref:AMP-binding protein n=1 Tax=Nocardia sp. TaxID=1821 RepID=UPI0026047B08|nr:AMP-binding protein [Nocardia sp.]MCU1644919.1 AMP-dependent synthetase and ligase [Nocardia sp.]
MTSIASAYSESAHLDRFVLDNLPPPDAWPELLLNQAEFAVPPRLNCVSDVLGGASSDRAEGLAILAPGSFQWSYHDLDIVINQVAQVLAEDLGMTSGNRVLVRGWNTPAFAAIWLAVVKAGGVVVPTMPLLRAKELRHIIDKAQITHVLYEQGLEADLVTALPTSGPAITVMSYDAPWGGELARAASMKRSTFEAVDTWSGDPCLIAFTSGTTGPAKATVHTHRDILAICNTFPSSILRANDTDRFIGSPPLAFTFGLGGLLLFPLTAGASTVLLDRASPEALSRGIEEYGATICFTAPTAYRKIATETSESFPALRICVSAGEPLPDATRQRWRERTGLELLDGLGSTELLHIFVANPPGTTVSSPGAIGGAVPGYRITVLDDKGSPVSTGTVGRLAVKGPTGCRYLADEARQRAYVVDGWNVTGDTGWIDESGSYHHVGRYDDMIVSAGYNISPVEIEELLLTHPGVYECGVAALPDPVRGQIVAAYVVPAAGWTADVVLAEDLQHFAKAGLAPYKYPRHVSFRRSLPRTDSGKLQRSKLSVDAENTR